MCPKRNATREIMSQRNMTTLATHEHRPQEITQYLRGVIYNLLDIL